MPSIMHKEDMVVGEKYVYRDRSDKAKYPVMKFMGFVSNGHSIHLKNKKAKHEFVLVMPVRNLYKV